MIDPGAGRVGFTARLVAGRSAARTLTPGQILTLHSSSSSLSGRTELTGQGLIFGVAAGLRLPADQTLVFRVLSLHPVIRLKWLDAPLAGTSRPGPASTAGPSVLLGHLGLPETPQNAALLDVLVQSRRALDPEVLRQLVTLLRDGAPERLRRQARSLVERSDRGMDPTARPGTGDGQEELAAFLVDYWPQRDHRDGRGTSADDETGPAEHDLRRYLRRATASPDHPLQVFNALRSSGETHWILIPLGASSGGRRVDGTLRLGLDPVSLSPHRAQLAIRRPGGQWRLWWERTAAATARSAAGPPPLTLTAWTSDAPGDPVPDALLARIGRTGHTGVVEPERGDGFVSEMNSTVDVGFEHYG